MMVGLLLAGGVTSWVAFLQPNEQLVLKHPSGIETRNGPGAMWYVPLITKVTKRLGTKLDDLSYVVVKNELTGLEFTVSGPQLYFLNPHEVAGKLKRKIVLEKHEYVRLLDATSGQQRLIKGPAKVVPGPFESIVNERLQSAVQLSKLQYVVVTDSLTGNRRVVTGPQLFFPDTYESVGTPCQAHEVQRYQYIKLLDQTTGTLRVERGEATVFPRAHEEAAEGGVKDAVNVDDETAVLVLSKASGQQRLITTKGLFFPEALEKIVEVRKLVRVQPHEVAIVRDNLGAFHFHSGNASGAGDGTAFFLPPHCELVTMYWSSATSKEDVEQNVVRNAKQVAYKVPTTKIDLRAQYAFFEYKVRTSDNVELLLEGTIFWQVVDVPRMIERTGDPKGDVWYHARSALIQAVSAVTLEQFMASFNTIVSRAAATDSAFYEQRGVRLHGLEVVRYECVDGKTAGVLQEIIQETTNRINRLQKQKSENEVEAERLHSQIEIERQRKQLIEAKTSNEKLQASVEGESEGTRLAQNTIAFLNMLNVSVPDDATRLQLLKFFTEQQTLTTQTEHLSKGKASLFLTPQDMQLRLQMPSD